MMTFGGGSFGWLSFLIWLALIAGIVLIVVWIVQAAGRGSDDEPLRELRSRFARGDIDATQFEEMRRVLGTTERPRADARVGLLGVVLIAGALVAGVLLSWLSPYGWGSMMGPGGMMWPMMGIGAAPTAPAETSVRMAGTRFEPPTLTIRVGDTVRWLNDDALPHTVSARDGSWDSGNLAPGASFERTFDSAGSYAYLCRYHPGMVGTIEVQAR